MGSKPTNCLTPIFPFQTIFMSRLITGIQQENCGGASECIANERLWLAFRMKIDEKSHHLICPFGK